MHILFQRKG